MAGLDYAGFGEWQQRYGEWMISALDLEGKHVLDIGCACGSIAAGLAEAGALVSGCDLSQHMIDLGREKWPGFPLFVCDAINLHLWRDETFHFLHSAQVFEHFRPELVPFILRELARVTKPNGLLFFALDTVELFERQKRDMSKEDPTHLCVKPRCWWEDQLREAGWKLYPEALEKLKNHPMSYFQRYDWEAFCCRKPSRFLAMC